MKNDINLIPPRAQHIGHIDAALGAQMRLIAQAREQGLRDLARPYLLAGYLPSELTAIERTSGFFQHGQQMYVCVCIHRKRSALRLWIRRVLLFLHLRSLPAVVRDGTRGDGTLWHE